MFTWSCAWECVMRLCNTPEITGWDNALRSTRRVTQPDKCNFRYLFVLINILDAAYLMQGCRSHLPQHACKLFSVSLSLVYFPVHSEAQTLFILSSSVLQLLFISVFCCRGTTTRRGDIPPLLYCSSC